MRQSETRLSIDIKNQREMNYIQFQVSIRFQYNWLPPSISCEDGTLEGRWIGSKPLRGKIKRAWETWAKAIRRQRHDSSSKVGKDRLETRLYFVFDAPTSFSRKWQGSKVLRRHLPRASTIIPRLKRISRAPFLQIFFSFFITLEILFREADNRIQ